MHKNGLGGRQKDDFGLKNQVFGPKLGFWARKTLKKDR